MRRSASSSALIAASGAAVLLAGCQLDSDAEPERDAATVSETLPEDAGDLENPTEVTSPGGGSGETEDGT